MLYATTWSQWADLFIHIPDSKVHVAHMGPTGSCRSQVDPMSAPWTLLSGVCTLNFIHAIIHAIIWMINNSIAYKGAAYIRGLAVLTVITWYIKFDQI